MPHRYDAAVKTLIEQYPLDWLRRLGVPVEGAVTLVEADLSTVSADADRLLRIEAPEPTLVDLELQSSRDPKLPYRLLLYAALALYRHQEPLLGMVVLLRREADAPELTGHLSRVAAGGGRVDFTYRVVRLWEQEPEWALEGGLGMVPLAPLTHLTVAELPGVLEEMKARLGETEPALRATLWTTAYILMGLRYPREVCEWARREVEAMKESVTYQAILEEGREQGLEQGREQGLEEGREQGLEQGLEQGREQGVRHMLLRQGEARFGAPEAEVVQALQSLPLDRLEALSLLLLRVESWDELLAE